MPNQFSEIKNMCPIHGAVKEDEIHMSGEPVCAKIKSTEIIDGQEVISLCLTPLKSAWDMECERVKVEQLANMPLKDVFPELFRRN